MAKKAEPTRAQAAARVAKKTARGVVSLGVWTIGIVLLALTGYLVFRDEGPATKDRTPEGIIEAYSELVRPYIPPSQSRPSSSTVSSWLEYFDDSTGDWLAKNADKLSYMRFQRDPGAWKKLTSDERRSEAVVYLLTYSPLRGGKVEAARRADDGNSANVDIRTTGTVYKVSMVKDGRTWRARELMGRMAELDAILAKVELPK